jgi:hypothetical protein
LKKARAIESGILLGLLILLLSIIWALTDASRQVMVVTHIVAGALLGIYMGSKEK